MFFILKVGWWLLLMFMTSNTLVMKKFKAVVVVKLRGCRKSCFVNKEGDEEISWCKDNFQAIIRMAVSYFRISKWRLIDSLKMKQMRHIEVLLEKWKI